MSTNPHQDALRSRWTLEGTIPLSGVADGAVWHRARSVATGDPVTLFIVRGGMALEAADAVRRAYLVEDPHLMPVRDVVVLDDPRDSEAPGAGSHPTTVVEYPLPPAPPLAALLAKGPLHPETARAVVGEAATGLEVARRRGLRHQFLDSNRVFVDTSSGQVTVLGVGVEAAAHPDLDRSREVASFQDTAALTALLYRSLTGRSPRPAEDGTVPRPSAMIPAGSPQIPADLDLLCEMVLNESAEEIPETTRGLIAALEPWQSIPVTLEAYRPRDEQSPRSEAGPSTGPRTQPQAPVEEPTGLPDEDTERRPAASPSAPARQQERGQAPSTPDPASASGVAASAAAAGMVGAAGREAVGHPAAGPRASEQEAAEQRVTEQRVTEQEAAEQAAARERAEHRSANATAIVHDLQLDQKRSGSAFPGHLEITLPRRPQPADDGSTAAAGLGGIVVSGGAVASAPGGARTVGGPAGPEPAVTPAAAAAGGAAAGAAIPSRRSGTHWPLARAAGQADADQLTPRSTSQPPPSRPEPATGQAEPVAETGEQPGLSAPTPATAVHHSADETSPTPVAGAGRTEPSTADTPTGPIVVRGREHSSSETQPAETTQPLQRSTLLRDVVNVAVDSDDPGTFAMGPSQPEQRSRQSQWILLGGVLLVILAMVFALSSITSGLRERVENPLNTQPATTPAATEEEPTEEEPTEEEPTEEEPLPAAQLGGVQLFVQGSEQEPDNADQVDRITDGDPGTFWSTQHYTSPQYGGLKDGVGVRVDLTEQSTLSAVVVTTARNSGGTLELRAVSEDGSLGEVLAGGEFAGDGEIRFELDEPVETDSAAVWLSALPPDSNEQGRFRGRIAEIRVE